VSVKDDIEDASDKIVTAINTKGNQQISLLTQIQNGVNVTLLPLDTAVENQLQILFTAAINAAQPISVDINNPSSLQAVMEAALTFAANNLQFDVLSTQNGTWTVDLSVATISAIEDAFENALGSTIVSVNLNTSPVTVTLDGLSLAALENTNVTVLGQPINVTVTNPVTSVTVLNPPSGTVTIDNASVAAIASAIAGQNINVNVLGQPLSITGTINLGDVSALTNWLSANSLTINDSGIIAAINAISVSVNDITDDDVRPSFTPKVSVGCETNGKQWYTFWERKYNEIGGLSTNTQYWTDGSSLTTIIPPGLSTNKCRTVNGTCEAFSGNSQETLAVPAGEYGNIKLINDRANGVVRVTFDGSNPANGDPEFSGAVEYNLNGVDLSQMVFEGSVPSSRYTVCYETTI
jgi:hypothetical protein